jgi:hypothetical protein
LAGDTALFHARRITGTGEGDLFVLVAVHVAVGDPHFACAWGAWVDRPADIAVIIGVIGVPGIIAIWELSAGCRDDICAAEREGHNKAAWARGE